MIKQVKLKVGATHPVPTGAIMMREVRDGGRITDSTRPNHNNVSVTGVREQQDGTGAYRPAPKPRPFILRGWNRVES